MSIILETRQLTKEFGPHKAVQDVNFKVQAGSIHAIIGENGAGKSTLMKLIFGLYKPTHGEILYKGQPVKWASPVEAIHSGIGMVHQHFSLLPTSTAIDNIVLGFEPLSGFGRIDRKKAIEEIEKLLPSESLRVPWHKTIEELSIGERQRVEILKVLYRRADFLILDEPTAVLTPQESEDLYQVMKDLKKSGRTIVIISHKIHELLPLADDYTVLKGGVVTGTGKISEVNQEKLVHMMIGRNLAPKTSERTACQTGLRLKAEQVCDLEGRRLKNVSLYLHAGEVVGIAGVEGSGQKEFINSIIGLHPFRGNLEVLHHKVESGHVHPHGNIGFVPEDRLLNALWSQASCYHNLVVGIEEHFSKYGVMSEKKIRSTVTPWAQSLDVRARSLEQAGGELSGGNQQKLVFAREVFGKQPPLLICHQPTRGVDLGAMEKIHQLILQKRNEGTGVLLVSSDLDELMDLSDRIYVFYSGGITAELPRAQFDRFLLGKYMAGGQ
ncbi:MAG: ABC transporter ATP-binding protein [Bdellovibrionales bacterium]